MHVHNLHMYVYYLVGHYVQLYIFFGNSKYLQMCDLLLCAQGSVATANGGKRWQVGDICMAKYWQDNEVR